MFAETNACSHVPPAPSGLDQGMKKCEVRKENHSSYASNFRSTMHEANVEKYLKLLALSALMLHNCRRPLINMNVDCFDVRAAMKLSVTY